MRRHFSYFLRTGPLSILASALPGLVNYVIIVFLTYASSAAEAGLYRLIFSVFSLASILTLLETSKVFVRAVARNDAATMATLFIGRLYHTLAVGVVVVLAALAWNAVFPFRTGILTVSHYAIAIGLAIAYGIFDFYAPYLQARQKFETFFAFALVKYTVAFVLFVALIWAGYSVLVATIAQLAAMTLFHVAFFAVTVLPRLREARESRSPGSVLRHPASREAMTLSVANGLPNALEHIDKLCIGAVFGLEALGLYTLGFSTGRFIYNTLKPAIYIYYRQFVEALPPAKVVISVGIAFTVFGVLCAVAYLAAIQWVPLMHRFRGTEIVAVVIFLSYGVAMADAVYAQAYAINKDAKSGHLLVANLVASGICLVLFAIACYLPKEEALTAFAAHYFVRHALTLAFLAAYRRAESRTRP